MSDFRDIQQAFTAHIKSPQDNAFDYGIEDRRMKIYRELFFNNIMGFLDSGFPVLKSILGDEEWQTLGRAFFSQHHCRSPLFVDISKEFVEFLANEYELQSTEPPFMAELAHYEWVELDVSVRKGTFPKAELTSLTDDTQLKMSPLASLVSYTYPVHQIGPDFQPEQPGDPVYLVVYRDSEEDVEFTLINQVTAYMLNVIEQHDAVTLEQLLVELSDALPQLPPDQLRQATKEMLWQFIVQGVLAAQ